MSPAVKLLTSLHGPGPWQVVVDTGDQKAVLTDDPKGYGLGFVHRPRGLWRHPAFTSLNVDLPAGWEGRLPRPPTIRLDMENRVAAIWVLTEPAWPSADFYRRQQMLNVLLGTPQDHISLSRLIPLPGNTEFPCEIIDIDPKRRYRLADFTL